MQKNATNAKWISNDPFLQKKQVDNDLLNSLSTEIKKIISHAHGS